MRNNFDFNRLILKNRNKQRIVRSETAKKHIHILLHIEKLCSGIAFSDKLLNLNIAVNLVIVDK